MATRPAGACAVASSSPRGLDPALVYAVPVGDSAEEHQSLRQLGVSGTPTFFVNGRYVGGSQPFQNFKALIDEELAKANAIIRTQGVQPRAYYATQIMAKGRKGP